VNASTDSQIINHFLYADGKDAKELWLPAPGSALGKDRFSQMMIDEKLHYPEMNGRNVFINATKSMARVLGEALQKSGTDINDVDLFLFHQANLRINQKVAEILNIPEEKVFNTIQDFGNTTAATIPIGMDEAIKAGKLRPGMLVASAAFGSGFTWASALWRQ
jgi:3-oxoacyl-[acyl-carrier-protein] synthase-3